MPDKNSFSIKSLAADLLFDVAGGLVLSVSIQCFSAPNQIAPGGVTGLAILVNYLADIPISALNMIINVPLIIAAWFLLGHAFTLKTLKSVAVLTATLEIVSRTGLVYVGNPILAALYGGVLGGIGIALVFMRSSTTGGTDIASRLIQLKFPTVSVGKLLLLVDGCVLLAAAIVFRNIESALYGLIAIYATSSLVDSILYGLNVGKVMLIMSRKHSEIAGAVNSRMGRGCTILGGQGSYTGRDQPVLLCAVRKSELYELKQIVHEIDSEAFLMALEAGEIIGEGFAPHNLPK